MGIGIGYAYYYGMGSRRSGLRRAAFGIAAICLVGVVSSLARGAVLSAAAVLALIWARSPRKLATAAAGVAAAVVIAVAVSLVHPQGAFVAEMKTVSEGTESGTGLQRWVVWGIAMQLFWMHPVLGVGPANLGPTAAALIPDDPHRPMYSDIDTMWGFTPHNIFVEVLSEQGIVGAAAFLAMIVGFFTTLRRLRARNAVRAWNHAVRGRLDLRAVTLGLECAMVAFLCNGIFYNQLYEHWLWSMCALAYTLALVVRRAAAEQAAEDAPAAAVRGAAAPRGSSILRARRG